MIEDVSFAQIQVGDKAHIERLIAEQDIDTFAYLTGDYNPVHTDIEFAKNSMFKERVAHGMLSASFISTVFGMVLPGINSIYLSQELNFRAPVKIGDNLTITVEVLEKIEKKHRLIFSTIITNQNDKIVVDGKAVVMKK